MEKIIKFNHPEYIRPEIGEEPRMYIVYDGENFDMCKFHMSGEIPLFYDYSVFGTDTLSYNFNMKWIDFEEGKKHFHSFSGMSKEEVIEFMWKLEGGDMTLEEFTAKVTVDKFECEGALNCIYVIDKVLGFDHMISLDYFLADFEQWENPILIDLNKGNWTPFITEVPCQ
jgi:hypothetical protein